MNGWIDFEEAFLYQCLAGLQISSTLLLINLVFIQL